MRHVLLSFVGAAAVAAGLSFGSVAASAAVDPYYTTYSVFGKPKQVTVVRTTLFNLYGHWPKGFEPVEARTNARPANQELGVLPTGSGIGFVRRATLYWKYNSGTGFYEPKVTLTMYDYATVDYLNDPAKNPAGTIPIGLTDPSGAPFINPVTNQPIGTVSPTTTS
jgi:hypothetical protein